MTWRGEHLAVTSLGRPSARPNLCCSALYIITYLSTAAAALYIPN